MTEKFHLLCGFKTVKNSHFVHQQAMSLSDHQQNTGAELANQLYQAYQMGAPVYSGLGIDLTTPSTSEVSFGDRSISGPKGAHYMTSLDPYAIDRAARLHRNAAGNIERGLPKQ